MRKRVLIPIANGTEEVEAISVVDALRRAGAEVTVASINGLEITATRGVRIMADDLLSECLDEIYDLIVLPGGKPGTNALRDCGELIDMLHKQKNAGRLVAAICAAPVVILQHHGLIKGIRATCHPSLLHELAGGVDQRVIVDGSFITSQGPGTALEFALKLIELLFDAGKAKQVANAMVICK